MPFAISIAFGKHKIKKVKENKIMSLINKEISDFKAYAFHGDDFKMVSKEEILGKWSVFFFYPADFTFVCPTELEDLANKYEDFKNVGCEIYSVSTDTHFVHKAWHDASERIKKINYPMLADPTHEISRDFGVMSIPTVIAFRDGKEIKRNIGFMNQDDLNDFLEEI